MADLNTPMDDAILDVMYEHPERFHHLEHAEYVRILIEDIRYYKRALAAVSHAGAGDADHRWDTLPPAIAEGMLSAVMVGVGLVKITSEGGTIFAESIDVSTVTFHG